MSTEVIGNVNDIVGEVKGYMRIIPKSHRLSVDELNDEDERKLYEEMAKDIGLFLLKNGVLKTKKQPHMPLCDKMEYVVWLNCLIKESKPTPI